MNGFDPWYLKSNRGSKNPDFLIHFAGKEVIVEVGEKGKGREQFKGISRTEKMLLVHSDESDGIKYPLFMLGFDDINYFSRVFKPQTGLSPTEFRKLSLADHHDGIPG